DSECAQYRLWCQKRFITMLICCFDLSMPAGRRTSEKLPAVKRLAYPTPQKVNQIDDYNGVKVADPYRWLEDDNSAATKAWVEAENKVTFGYLEQIPERLRIRERLTKLWNYERYGVPFKE